ncbi:MAG: hypothetical protein ACHQ50_14725 [Fimbriimonadales bacterium]
MAKELPATAGNIARVAARTSHDLSRWAFGQWALRERARSKFRLADLMLFDRDGLEMSSHERVAEYHGSQFPEGVAVEDWGCGIGADLVAFARRGPAFGYEMDGVRAAYALHNLRAHGLDEEEAGVFRQDCLSLGEPEYAFCDPARRSGGKRTLKLGEFSPDPREVVSRFRSARLAGIKLSPMLSDGDLESFGGRLEFVSFGGECREALVWLGSESASAHRQAVHVESGEALPAAGDPPPTSTPGCFLFEADPAAIRAHCLGELCSRHALLALGDSNGYLTGDEVLKSPWLERFEVLTCRSADAKRTKAELRRLGGGTPIVKCRGARVDVDALRKELKGEGEELVVAVYPVGHRLKHMICRRL